MRASLKGWQSAVEDPAGAVEMMIDRFPEMAVDEAFHQASFAASIPLIIPGGTRLGALDCATLQPGDLDFEESFCSTEILDAIW